MNICLDTLSLVDRQSGQEGVVSGAMTFGLEIPSLSRSFSARISPRRYVRHSLGFKAAEGRGWFADLKKAGYNRVHNRGHHELVDGPEEVVQVVTRFEQQTRKQRAWSDPGLFVGFGLLNGEIYTLFTHPHSEDAVAHHTKSP
jgi:hypothetical protein